MSISAPVLAALTGPSVYRALYVTLGFRSGTMYVWQGEGSLSIGGKLLQGVGRMGSISVLEQPLAGKAPQISLSLSGLDSTILAETAAAETDVKGQPAAIALAVWDRNETYLGDVPILSAIMDRMVYAANVQRDDTKQTASENHQVTVTLESRLANRRLSPTNALYTQADQDARFPGDLGLQFAGTLEFKNYRWPVF